MIVRFLVFLFLLHFCLTSVPLASARQSEANDSEQQTETALKHPSTAQLREVVKTAFANTHDGWSSDEVVLNSNINDEFVRACQKQLPDTNAATFNWTLLNMRKAGQLDIATTKRNRRSVQEFAQIAEIAARLMHDRHQVSSDRIMADPKLRAEFDQEIKDINPKADLYSARKAAFQLRKQRKLRPELITRIADWGRQILSFSSQEVEENSDLVPALPGIYIFRDQSGYLYIGQSEDLRARLKEHLDASSNFSLARYLKADADRIVTIEIHAFDADSRAARSFST